MPAASEMSRFDHIRRLLESAAGGEAAAFGGIALWSLPHDQFIAARLMGLQLIETKKAAHSCCHSAAGAADTSGSALLLGLRGEQPFDGSQFPRLPLGTTGDVRERDCGDRRLDCRGAPETDPETAVYTFPEQRLDEPIR